MELTIKSPDGGSVHVVIRFEELVKALSPKNAPNEYSDLEEDTDIPSAFNWNQTNDQPNHNP